MLKVFVGFVPASINSVSHHCVVGMVTYGGFEKKTKIIQYNLVIKLGEMPGAKLIVLIYLDLHNVTRVLRLSTFCVLGWPQVPMETARVGKWSRTSH